MIQGPEPGSYYKLPDNRVTTIGRSSRNAVRVVTPTVSRFHCEISWVNGDWVLTDLNSKKGTIVNGEPVVDRTVLKAGDTLRLSSVLFRFDMVDETVEQDDMMLAIHEASLGQKLRSKGRATSSLAAIRARTRMAAEAAREKGEEQSSRVRVNAGFVGGVALAVALAVAAVLMAASRMPGATSGPDGARALYEQGIAALEAGNAEDGLQLLQQVQSQFPDSEAAVRAERRAAQMLWESVERTLARIAELEAEGNYAAALELYRESEAQTLPEGPRELLQERRDFTERLAHAAFSRAVDRAASLAQQGDQKAAEEVLARLRDKVGVPELAARAEAEITDLTTEN